MLYSTVPANEKRAQFRADLASGRLLRFPGAANPLSARLIEQFGFDGVYMSGAVIAADLGLPDIGLTTLNEVENRAGQVARMTDLPLMVDADTGFGEPMNAARTIQTFENAGIAGCHIEDQYNPKRCGHLDGKSVVPKEDMLRRISAASGARRDDNFVICARTDARDVEGLDAMIERSKAYIDAGADMIFPEALADESEFEKVRKELDVPILANMTEFGKSDLLNVEQLTSLGVNMVIYPVTLLRLAMGAIERGLQTLRDEGVQTSLLGEMQTRSELYKWLDYEAYAGFDSDIFNFNLKSDQ